jgi:hypothetical protein
VTCVLLMLVHGENMSVITCHSDSLHPLQRREK